MAEISILQRHKLSHAKAKAAAQKVADKLVEEYDMELEWHGDVLRFERNGVTGTLAVHENEARLELTLGLLLSAFAPTIEAHVAENMKKAFRQR